MRGRWLTIAVNIGVPVVIYYGLRAAGGQRLPGAAGRHAGVGRVHRLQAAARAQARRAERVLHRHVRRRRGGDAGQRRRADAAGQGGLGHGGG
ncbi:hypothetical protein ACFSTC_31415 [Nonomuraea ferruginea]